MNDTDRKKAAARFVENWKSKGGEKQHAQQFWSDLLHQILGITDFSNRVQFEKKVPLGHESFIDVYIPESKTIIEQKSKGVDLLKKKKQSDGSQLNAFEQARRYNSVLPHDENARWIVTCNFDRILIYNMNNIRPADAPIEILLEDLPEKYHKLNFLIDPSINEIRTEAEISEDAGYYVGKLYDALRKMSAEPDSTEALHGLNVLMVRLVFLLYAEDAGLLQSHTAFGDFCKSYNPENLRSGLKDLFRILDEEEGDRDPDEPEKLRAFPYINGNLFSNAQKVRIPQFSEEAYNILVNEMSYGMDWKKISPTIFGMVFESTLDSKMRRAGGMHYTSLENIHKILDNLFLNDLQAELEKILAIKSKAAKNKALDAFREKLSKIHILDPAAGSGNFLTESYLSLRRLENTAIEARYQGEMFLGAIENPIKVSINQLHGIEINDFAVAVAKTALWIAEAQMYESTRALVAINEDFLPLHSNSNMVEGNALQLDWNNIVSRYSLTYIIGNPPFLGYSHQTKEQKTDILSVYVDETGKPYKKAGKIDYVAAWYFKAAEFIQGTQIRVAFVSTNSITQGEQVAGVWQPLYKRFGIHIDFAFRTFQWESQSTDAAAVHVVIICFSTTPYHKQRKIFDNDTVTDAQEISPYLINFPLVFIESRNTPICNIPPMVTGNRPADGGALIIEEKDYQDFISKEPKAIKYIKPLLGAEEFINNKKRYCLWLVDVSPSELRSMSLVVERVNLCKQNRLTGAADRKKLAETPTLFRETFNPETAIVVPVVSSENRKYVPMDYINKNTICTDRVKLLPDAGLYHFGVLESNVNMAWLRAVCGRLEMRYNYSKDIVYNNFPWPVPTDQQKAKIEQTAQAILDARAKYPESSLADLYDETIMPADLRKAHKANDRAVMEAYGMFGKVHSESECVEWLFRMYQELTKEK